MFEFYKENIDLNDQTFLRFLSEYLEKKTVNVEGISYHELYSQIRNAIQEFLHVRSLGGSVPRSEE